MQVNSLLENLGAGLYAAKVIGPGVLGVPSVRFLDDLFMNR
jgi:hypothetical protein